jgi:uncharacterized protein
MKAGISTFDILGDFFKNSRAPFKILLAIMLMFLFYLIVTFISIAIAISLFKLSWGELNISLTSGIMQADTALLKYFQVAQTIGLFLVPALILNYLIFPREERFLTPNKFKMPFLILGIVLVSLVVSIPLVSKLIEWNSLFRFPEWGSEIEILFKRMEEERNLLTERMLDGRSIPGLLINLMIIAILPAISEEFIFRGILQKLLTNWFRSGHTAIFISAILFSAIHFQFYGFFPRLLLGIYFGYLFYWSRNIWVAVWAHFANNAIAVLLLYLENTGKNNLPELLREESQTNASEVLFSLCLTVLTISLLWGFLIHKSTWFPKKQADTSN